MFSQLMQKNVHRMVLLILPMVPAVAWADLPKQFTLGKHVPSECWLYTHAAHNPEREWIDQKWGEVFKAAGDLGIDRDVTQLVLSFLQGEERAQAEALIDKFMKHVKAIRWSDLAYQEFVFAQRLAASKKGNEQLFLARGKADSAEHNFATLKGLLKEISGMSGEIVFEEREQGGVQRVSLNFKNPEAAELGFALEVFRSKDIIGLSTGKEFAEKVAASLGGSALDSLVEQARFQKALAMVPAPEDEIVFFDLKVFLHDMNEMLAGVRTQIENDIGKEPQSEGAAKGKAVLAIMSEAFAAFDVGDFSIASATTEDRQQKYVEVTRLQDGKKDNICAQMFLKRKPFEQFDRYIPAEAKSFELTAFIDLERVYNYVLEFVRKNVPNGPALVQSYEAKLTMFGIDLERDFFSWWSGEMINFEIPPAIASPMASGDGVLMIRVKDPKIAAEKVFGVLDFVSARAQENGQMFTVPPANIAGGDFRQLSHPMMAMFGASLVIGVSDNWLMIGTAGAVNKSLAVAKGDQPSIMKNEQFTKEGLVPKGPFLSASFTDKSKFGTEMGAMLGMIGMFGQMGVANIPEDNPEAAKTKQILRSLLGIAMKLGPVLQKIDFLSSESSITTYDGDLTMRKDTVITYKPKSEGSKAEASK